MEHILQPEVSTTSGSECFLWHIHTDGQGKIKLTYSKRVLKTDFHEVWHLHLLQFFDKQYMF